MGRVSIEDIIRAYQETGSVWKAGKRLGIAGQTVHGRLQSIGHHMSHQQWTSEEHAELLDLIQSGVTLSEAANRLGRSYNAVAVRVNRAGLKTNYDRRRKLPRGAGYDKASMGKHLKALRAYPHGPTRYARSVGISIEMLIRALQQHYPAEWSEWVEERFADVPRKTCPYCSVSFIPTSGKQIYDTRACAGSARTDHGYFAGNRRSTIGLAERTCQQCGRSDVKGLSSHHVRGKENDPEGTFLIALCPGCHQLVTMLGGRTWVDEPAKWESLIQLAWLRRHGDCPEGAISTYVDIEFQEGDDEDEDVAAVSE